MLEEIYEDNLIGDPNDLEEIIEQQAEELEDDPEAQEIEANAENDNADNETAADNVEGTRVDLIKKRTVRNPQPKLNPERLKGPRGIAILEKSFEDFKFHGKGYERVDLNKMMKRLEHWAHRLFPRFQFDDCLEKIEKLGQKETCAALHETKPSYHASQHPSNLPIDIACQFYEVYVKKIRMGLETGEEPIVLHDDDEDEQNDPLQDAYDAPIDAFDELIGHQLSQVQANQTNIPVTPLQAGTFSPPPSSYHPKPVELTTEQKERILKNRLLAEERKLARMKAKREMEKIAQEPSISVSNTSSTNSSSYSGTIDIPNEESAASTSSVFNASSVIPSIFEIENAVSTSDSSHKDKISSSSDVEETGSLFGLVEQHSAISKLDDDENNHPVSSVFAEQNKLEHIISRSDNSHKNKTSSATIEETGSVSLLGFVEQQSTISISDDDNENSHSLNSGITAQNKLAECPHRDKTSSSLAAIEETESISLLKFNEQQSVISIPDVEENNHPVSPSLAEHDKLVHISEPNQLEPVLPDHEQQECIPQLDNNEQDNVESDIAVKSRSIDMLVNAGQNLVPASFDNKENNSAFSLGNEHNLISAPDFTRQNIFTPMSVDGEQNNSPSVLPNKEQNSNFKPIINDQQNNSLFLSIDKDQNKTVSMSVDADQNNSNSMLVDNEQNNVPKLIENAQNNAVSMLVDNEVNESTCMSVDVEQNSPTSMSIDNEQSNSIPMSVDNEQSNLTPLLLENDLTYMPKDEQNMNSEQKSEEESVISNVLQQNDNAVLDISEEITYQNFHN